jgi:hypothetical protein
MRHRGSAHALMPSGSSELLVRGGPKAFTEPELVRVACRNGLVIGAGTKKTRARSFSGAGCISRGDWI